MSNFREATRQKLRVSTSQGLLTVEQLWELPLSKLATAIKNVKKTLQKDNDDELSFLDESKNVDKTQQLTFDVLKEIYLTKKEEADAAKSVAEIKAHNEKILSLIHQKQESELSQKSVQELQALLK
jgi:hypothetical protein